MRVKREVTGRARYEEIANDLARRIAQGELQEGARILGRSSLAGTYQVSPETIRRAVAILYERGIVQSVAGSGIRVLSKYAAMEYLDSLRTRNSLEEGARELRSLLKQRRSLDELIDTALDRVLSQATAALASRHVEEITIREGAWVVGRSLGEIRLRSRSGATVLALSRGDVDQFSPPPDMLLAPGDVLTLIGPDAARHMARHVIEVTEEPDPVAQ